MITFLEKTNIVKSRIFRLFLIFFGLFHIACFENKSELENLKTDNYLGKNYFAFEGYKKINIGKIESEKDSFNQNSINLLENNLLEVTQIQNGSIENSNGNTKTNNINDEENVTPILENSPLGAKQQVNEQIEVKKDLIIAENSISSFVKTIFSGFSVIILAEIGDKTFFLTMIFSAENSFFPTLLIASSVLITWNLISLLIGSAIPVLLFKGFLDFLGMCIFLIFGFSMLYSAYHMDHDLIHKGLNETRSELNRSGSFKVKKNNTSNGEISPLENNNLKEPLLNTEQKEKNDIEINESGKLNKPLNSNNEEQYEEFGFHSKWAFASSLIIAEFGDKSQISAIIMGSTQNFYAILIGTSLARICGVIIALLFGKIISKNITHKQVTYLGAVIFIFFGFVYMYKFFF